MTATLATSGPFTIYQVTRTAWAIERDGEHLCNVRASDAARYGVPFNRAGAVTYAGRLDEWEQEAAANRAAERESRLARAKAWLAERVERRSLQGSFAL